MLYFSPWHFIVLVAIVAIGWFVFWFAGLGIRAHDWAWAAFAVGIAIYFEPDVLTPSLDFAASANFLAAFISSHWILWSVAHAVESRVILRLQPRKSGSYRHLAGSTATPQRLRVGLALSGGGYRAALYHAGVVSMLEELSIPIDVVGSISGGSIFASAYVTGTGPRAFVDVVASGELGLRRELLTIQAVAKLAASVRIPWLNRPLLPGCSWSRTRVQADLIDRVFLHGAMLRDLQNYSAPNLMIGATDLTRSSLIGATAEGVFIVHITPVIERLLRPAQTFGTLYRNHGPMFCRDVGRGVPTKTRLADIVAASGAFPGALNAVTATDMWVDGTGHESELRYTLVDGGVIDNYGHVLLLAADHLGRISEQPATADAELLARWKIDALIISDGSAYPVTRERLGLRDQIAATMDTISDAGAGNTLLRDRVGPEPATIVLSPRGLLDCPFSAEDLSLPLSVVENVALRSQQLGDKSFDLPIDDRDRFLEELDEDLKRIVLTRRCGVQPKPLQELIDWRREHLKNYGPWAIPPPFYEQEDDYTNSMDIGALVELEIWRRIRDFASTSTLDDRIDWARANSLYRLGRQVTLIGHQHLAAILRGPRQSL